MSGPMKLTIKAGGLGDRILRRCHEEGLSPDEATAALWEKALRREEPILIQRSGEQNPATRPLRQVSAFAADD